MTVPVALSVAAHGLGLLLLIIGGRFSWPSAPIPIELTPTHKRVQAPASEPRRPEPPPPSGSGKSNHKKDGAAKASDKPEPPPPATSDLKPFAPDDANLVLLVRA